jgi:hypothetical protein
VKKLRMIEGAKETMSKMLIKLQDEEYKSSKAQLADGQMIANPIT